eukprot:1141751-Rhodomonas_salina.1
MSLSVPRLPADTYWSLVSNSCSTNVDDVPLVAPSRLPAYRMPTNNGNGPYAALLFPSSSPAGSEASPSPKQLEFQQTYVQSPPATPSFQQPIPIAAYQQPTTANAVYNPPPQKPQVVRQQQPSTIVMPAVARTSSAPPDVKPKKPKPDQSAIVIIIGVGVALLAALFVLGPSSRSKTAPLPPPNPKSWSAGFSLIAM